MFLQFTRRSAVVLFRRVRLRSGRGDSRRPFSGRAFGVEGEEAGEDFVAEGGGPEEAALIGVVVLVGLVEEDGLGAFGEVVPAAELASLPTRRRGARRDPFRRGARAGGQCPRALAGSWKRL